jgi:hypothetical protein
MERYPGMKIVYLLLLGAVLSFAACSQKPSDAPVGASDGDQARTSTTTTTQQAAAQDVHAGHATADADGATDHSAHGTMTAGSTMDHSTMDHSTMDHSRHTGAAPVDHAAMGHTTASGGTTGRMDHAAMGHGAGHAAAPSKGQKDPHASHRAASPSHETHGGMKHGPASSSADPHAAHRQSTAVDHSQHGAAQHVVASAPSAPAMDHSAHGAAAATRSPSPAAPRSNSEMQRLRPESNLQPDAFDAPAPASVAEAAKASGGGHAGHGTVDHSQHGASSSTTPSAGLYVCPMHPEVTSEKPGTCPKCGMDLVKKN